MEAGRDLDALVAMHVMGVDLAAECGGYQGEKAFDSCSGWVCTRCGAEGSWGEDFDHTIQPFPYSTQIEAAWQVVEKLRDEWTAATETVPGTNRVVPDKPFDDEVFFNFLHRQADRRWPWAFLYVTPLAICEAALRAVGCAE
jgi:hypothetical protein